MYPIYGAGGGVSVGGGSVGGGSVGGGAVGGGSVGGGSVGGGSVGGAGPFDTCMSIVIPVGTSSPTRLMKNTVPAGS